MTVYELNLDGLVGPTHHYSGLSNDNVASTLNALSSSNPQAAALQGLEKMRFLHNLGLKQGLLPPHQRPNLQLLHQLGFSGSPTQQIVKAAQSSTELLSACYSASSMWTANTATVSASMDTLDNKVHFTPANLLSNLHRHHEADFSPKLLQSIFANPQYFSHHPLLPRSIMTSDEGAANHNRICKSHSHPGINLYVYGKQTLGPNKYRCDATKYSARQTKEASEIIARSHQIKPEQALLVRQNPVAIDHGVFHNDVISVANESVFLIHQEAFFNQADVLKTLNDMVDFPLTILQVSNEQVSLNDAVESYLFNSQLITLPDQKNMLFLAPLECENHPKVKAYLDEMVADSSNPINQIIYLDLKQSMRNGGGPSCLRLRVPLNQEELNAMHQGVLVDNQLLDVLDQWVIKHYRTELFMKDLADPQLMNESLTALDELTQILKLGSIYPFQSELTQ